MAYFKSEQVKVFPCSYRGIANEDGTLDTSVIIDPESRLSTEKNLTQLGRIQNAASDTRSVNSGIEEEIRPFTSGEVLKCVIDGYHFEITLRPGDFSPRPNMAVGIKTKEVNLIDDVKTTTLENLKNSAASFLDDTDGYFCGLVLDSTEALKAGGYKFVEIINSDGSFNKDNLIGSVALDVTPSQELYADKDGKIKSFDITYGIGSDTSFTDAEDTYNETERSSTINFIRGFNRSEEGKTFGVGKYFKIQSGWHTSAVTSDVQGSFWVNKRGEDPAKYLDGTIFVSGLSTADSPTFKNVTATNKITTKDLSVTGTSTLTGKVAANGGLDVTGKLTAGSAEIAGNLKASSTNITNKLTAGSAEITGSLKAGSTTLGTTTINGTLTATTINGTVNGKVSGQGAQHSPKESTGTTIISYEFSPLKPGLYAVSITSDLENPYERIVGTHKSETTVMVSIDKLSMQQTRQYVCWSNNFGFTTSPFVVYKKDSYNNDGKILITIEKYRTDMIIQNLRKIIEY